MKKLIILPLWLSLLAFTYAQNQDWRPVRTDDTYFYFGNSEYRAYRIDSVWQTCSKTSLFSFNELFAFSVDDCHNPFGASWIGLRIDNYADSTVTYNFNNEAIVIHNTQKIGNSWILYANTELQITATVIAKKYENIGFTNDSIVEIELVGFKNKETYTIKLSKNHGWVKTFNFIAFPDINTQYIQLATYTLTGCLAYKNSESSLNGFQIYNYQIGDEFHTYRRNVYWPEETVVEDNKVIRVVESKSYNSDSTEVSYVFNRCDKDGISSEEKTYNLVIDRLNHLPYQASYDDALFDGSLCFGQMSKLDNGVRLYDFGGGFEQITDSCYTFIFIDKNPAYYYPNISYPMQAGIYYEGLGGPYFDRSFMYETNFFELVYYKKDDLEWGEPYTCEEILSVNNLYDQACIKLFPNPTHDFISIELPEKHPNVKLELYNELGLLLFTSSISNTAKISVKDFPPGVLIYKLKTEDRYLQTGRIIKN